MDMSTGSRCLAFFLDGTTQSDDDIYVMINADDKDLNFKIQEGRARDWQRFVDTSRKSPHDISEPDRGIAIKSRKYLVKARSVVVFVRKRKDESPAP